MMESKVCPGCGRHCPADSLSCDRGREIMARRSAGSTEEKEGGWRFRDTGRRGPMEKGEHEMHEYREHRHEHMEGEERHCRPGFGHGCGPMGRGPHGPGRHHGGPGMGHRPHGPLPDITKSEHYAALDTAGKLAVMVRELGRTGRILLEGKGGQSRILELLAREGGMTQRTLTEHLGIQPGSVSEILGKLEGAGLITRSPNEEDRRTVDLALTEAGRARLEEGHAERETRVQAAFEGLTEEEKNTLLTLMEKLRADWREKLEARHHGPREEQE